MPDNNTIYIKYANDLKSLRASKKEYAQEMENIKANPNVSNEMKKEMDKVWKAINENEKKIEKAFDRITDIEISSKQFGKFQKEVDAYIGEMIDNINLLSQKMESLGTDIDTSKSIASIEKVTKSIQSENKAVAEVINTAKKVNSKVVIASDVDVSNVKLVVDYLDEAIQKRKELQEDDPDYSDKDDEKIIELLKEEHKEFTTVFEDAKNLAKELKKLDPNTDQFKVANAQLQAFVLQLKNMGRELDVLEAEADDRFNIEYPEDLPKGFWRTSEISKFLNAVGNNSKEASILVNELYDSLTRTAKVVEKEELGSDGAVSLSVGISTTTDSLYKQLILMINKIQRKLNERGAVLVPVKLVVEGTPYSESKKDDLVKNVAKEAKKTSEEVVGDVERITRVSLNTILALIKNKFKATNSEIITSLKNAIANQTFLIKVKVDPKSIEDIENDLQADKLAGEINISKTLDDTAEKAKKIVEILNSKKVGDYSDVLNDIREVVLELKGIKDLIDGLKEGKITLGSNIDTLKFDVSELQEIFEKLATSIENVRADISKPMSLDSQWFSIGTKFKELADETGKIDFRKKRTELKEFLEEYEKYVSLGGTNTLSMLTNNSSTLAKLQSKTTVSVDSNRQIEEANNHMRELADTLDTVYSKLSTIQDIINKLKLEEAQIKTFQQLASALSLVGESLEKIGAVSSQEFLGDYRRLGSIVDILERVDKLKNVANVFKGLKVSNKNLEGLKQLPDVLEDVAKKLREIEKLPTSEFIEQLNQISKNAEALKSLSSILNKSQKQIKETLEKTSSEKTLNLDKQFKQAEKYQKLLNKLRTEDNLSKYGNDYKSILKEIETNLNEIDKMKGFTVITQDEVDRAEGYLQIIEELNLSLKGISRLAPDTSISKMESKIADLRKTLSTHFGVDALVDELDNLDTRLHQVGLSSKDLNQIAVELNRVRTSAISAGKASTSFIDAVKTKIKYGWAQNIARFFSFYDIIRYIRQISGTVTELNSNLIELAKVSDTSIGELYNQFRDFGDIAKETGGTINDIIKSTADWARNGYNLPDAKKLAELSSIFQNIGDGLSEAQANEYLVSILKGFNLEVDQTIEIMDKVNNVSNNAASSVANIGEALERSSSAFGAANTNLSESIALVTTANEVLQNPETVGTAMKTLSARLRSSATELEELGEETTLTTSKLRALVQALTGVDIQKDANSFKSIYNILLEIGKEWKNLTDIEQASLSEALFGKRNAQVGFSILNNVERLQEIYALAEDSAGSAMEEQSKYLQGVQYQIDRFSASVEQLANDVMSSDFLKNAIKIGTNFVNLLDTIIDKLGSIPAIFAAIGAAMSFKGLGIDDKFLGSLFGKPQDSIFAKSTEGMVIDIDENDISALTKFFNQVSFGTEKTKALEMTMEGASDTAKAFAKDFDISSKAFLRGTDFIDEYKGHLSDLQKVQADTDILENLGKVHNFANAKVILDEFNGGLKNVTLSQEQYAAAVSKTWPQLGNLIAKCKTGKVSMLELAAATVQATVVQAGLKIAAMGVQMVLSAFAGFVVSKLFEAVDGLIHRNEKLIEKYEEATQVINETTDALKNQQKTISDSAKRFAELSQGVDQLTGKNLSLSDEDYKEFLDISNELAEVFPTLSHHYDENGQAIVDLTGDVDGIVGSLNAFLDAERKIANQKILEKMPEVFEGAMAKINDEYVKAYSSDEEWKELETERARLQSIIDELNDGILYGSVVGEEAINSTKKQIAEYGLELSNVLDSISQKTNVFNKQITSSLSSYISAWLYSEENFQFQLLDDNIQAGIQNVINNFDWKGLNFSSWDEAKNYITDKLLSIFNNPQYGNKVQYQFGIALEVETLFNNNEISAEEYNKRIKEFVELINSLPIDDKLKKSIIASLGIELDVDNNIINTQVNNIIKQLENSGIDKELASYISNNLNKKELDALEGLDVDWDEILDIDGYIKAVDKMRSYQAQGNVDLFNRPKVSGSKMQQAGWDVDSNSTATVFSSMFDVKGKDGKTAIVHVTPILPNGEVLSPEELENYVYQSLDGANDILGADSKGIVLKVDEDVATDSFGKVTDEAWQAADEWDVVLHELQEKVLLEGELTAEDALRIVQKYARDVSAIPFEINFDKEQVKTATEGIKELQSTYQTIYDKMSEGKVGEDLALLVTDVDALGEKLGNISEYQDVWDNFSNIVTDGTHSFEEMEDALNQVLTAYTNATITLESFDKEQADLISTQLQLAGVTKESAEIYVSTLTEVANAIDEAEEQGIRLTQQLDEEGLEFIELADMTDTARQQLILYVLQKQAANGLVINTSADIANLQQLMNWAGVTCDSLARLIKLKALLSEMENQIVPQERLNNINAEIERLTNQSQDEILSAVASKQAELASLEHDQAKLSSKSSSGKEEDPWKEAYEKELAELDHYHEMGLISDINYYEERERLNDKYFKDREKYTEEYNKNLEEIYKGFQSAYKQYVDDMTDYWQKSLDAGLMSFQDYCSKMKNMLDSLHDARKIDDETYYTKLADYYGSVVDNYDKVISAVQRALKRQIDGLNKQKKAIKESYEAQIKLIQDEIDGLQKANDARQKEIDLQKQLYELNRAQNQRTEYRYESDKGFVYRANDKDIKDAQEQVEQTKYEQYISSLEEKIESLKTEMDSLTDGIDAQIDKIQEYSDKWGEVANKYKEQQEDMIAASVLGSNWQNEILALNENTLINFTSSYISMQQQQADAAVNAANVIVEAYNKQIEALNKWKEAQATAAQTSGTSGLGNSSIDPNNGGKSGSKGTEKRNVASRVNASMTSASINNKYAKYNDRLAKHYSYGSGTDKAKPGYQEVAEGGDEILVDNYGNAYLLKGKQLHRFEGGEKVYSSNETKELLKGQYIPIDSLLPNYSSMLSKIASAPLAANAPNTNVLNTKGNVAPMKVDNSVHIDIGDIHVTEVNNANEFAKAITNHLPNALLQELNKR